MTKIIHTMRIPPLEPQPSKETNAWITRKRNHFVLVIQMGEGHPPTAQWLGMGMPLPSAAHLRTKATQRVIMQY